MNLIKVIRDSDVVEGDFGNEFSIHREAVRAVVFNEKGEIALNYVSKYDFFKVPGGGIDPGETQIEALDRECVEEIGWHIEVDGEIGLITEYRGKFQLQQDSYCYLAHAVGEQLATQYTQKELDEGFEVVWMSLEEGLKKIKAADPQNYEGKWVQAREMLILESAEKILKQIK
ncbi:MAG TPA: NUDIX domain-containing protein [Patescibacteria group bacterium]